MNVRSQSINHLIYSSGKFWWRTPWRLRNKRVHDTIRYYTIYLRALKSCQNGQLS